MSRQLEALWAVVFDTLGLRWEYEVGKFWLPDLPAWVEVRATRPTETESARAAELATVTGRRTFIFVGSLPSPRDGEPAEWESGYAYIPHNFEGHPEEAYWDHSYRLCECPCCGLIGIEFEGRADRLPCKEQGCPGDGRRGDRGHNYASPRLLRAYAAAAARRIA